MLATGGLVAGLFALAPAAHAAAPDAPLDVVDGNVYGWGWESGQTSGPWESTFPNEDAPYVDVAVHGNSGGNQTTLAVTESGDIVTQGDYDGLVTLMPDSLASEHVIAVDIQRTIAGEPTMAAAVTDDGGIVTWGGATPPPAEYQNPTTPTGVVDVQLGHAFGVALKDDGSLISWGNQNIVNKTPDAADFIKVITSSSRVLALTADGKVYAWDDTGGMAGRFQNEAPASGIVDIGIGGNSSANVGYAVTSEGAVITWGGGANGPRPVDMFPSDQVSDPVVALSETTGGFWGGVALTDQGEFVGWGGAESITTPQINMEGHEVKSFSFSELSHFEIVFGPEEVAPPEPGVVNRPRVTGDPVIGTSVSGTPASWNFTPTAESSGWYAAATADAPEGEWTLVGETDSLALTEDLDGQFVVYRSQATHEDGTTFVANSDPVGPVAPLTPAVVEEPKVQGVPVINTQLIGIGAKFNFTPTEVSSGWYAADSADAAAEDWSLVSSVNPYKLAAAQTDKFVVFRTTATDPEGGSWVEDSEPIGPVVQFASTTPPTISGDLVAGSTLTGVPGEFSYEPETVTYMWLIGGTQVVNVPPGDPVELKLTADHVGKTVKLFEQGSVAGLKSTGFSTETAPVAPAPLAVDQDATITGTAKEGETLTGTPATFAGGASEITVVNEWLADGAVIEGATGVELPLTAELVGKTITFRSTATAGEETVVSESLPSGPVASKIAASTSTVSVTGARSTWGKAHTVTVKVAAGEEIPAGTVTVKVGSLTKDVVLDSDGVATMAVPKDLKVGTYAVEAAYAGSDSVAPSSASAQLAITKASVKLSEKFAARIKKGKRAKGVVKATVVGSSLKVGGKVTIVKGKKVVGKGKLKNGKVTIKLAKLPKGKNKLTMKLGGTANTKAAKKTFVIKVK